MAAGVWLLSLFNVLYNDTVKSQNLEVGECKHAKNEKIRGQNAVCNAL